MSNSIQSPLGQPATEGWKAKIQTWATAHLNFIFGVLRFIKPILVLKKFALITRFTDVQEVLSRDDAFMVTYAEKMGIVTDGSNFFLGMEPTPRYTQDVSLMRIAIRRTDLDTIVAPLVEKYSTELVAKADGHFDAVQDLSRIVPAMLVEEYMGVSGPTRDDLIEWTTNLFYYLFFPDISTESERLAVSNAALLRKQLDQLIKDRKASGEVKDDALGRLLSMQAADLPGVTNEDIRNNLIGIIIGLIPTTSKCVALVLDYLLDHPDILSQAKKAAEQNDLVTLNKYVLESLRFNVFGPGFFRECIKDYVVAKGAFRSKKIRKGTQVLVATQSAMWDGRELQSPKKFSIDRPAYQYMPYGYGMHTCFGQYINNIQIGLILKALLVKDNLKRVSGDEGRLQSQGAFPSHLRVTFTA